MPLEELAVHTKSRRQSNTLPQGEPASLDTRSQSSDSETGDQGTSSTHDRNTFGDGSSNNGDSPTEGDESNGTGIGSGTDAGGAMGVSNGSPTGGGESNEPGIGSGTDAGSAMGVSKGDSPTEGDESNGTDIGTDAGSVSKGSSPTKGDESNETGIGSGTDAGSAIGVSNGTASNGTGISSGTASNGPGISSGTATVASNGIGISNGTGISNGPVSNGTGGNACSTGTGGHGGSDWSNGTGGGTTVESCMVCNIGDNDPRVSYTGPWAEPVHWSSTVRMTQVAGSTVSVRFNGSSIIVFGVVPACNQSQPPATAAYFLDTMPASSYTTTLPQAAADVGNYPLYISPQILSNEEHRLFINVTHISAPYTLSGFFVQAQASGTQDSISSTATETTSSRTSMPGNSQKAVRVVAGVLGSLVLLFVIGTIIYLILRWRTHAQREAERCCENSSRPDTIYTSFTRTESILRNDPSMWDLSPSNSFSDGFSQCTLSSETEMSNIEFASPSVSKPPSTSTSHDKIA